MARMDHLGMAVRSIAAARGFYEALGLTVVREELDEQERLLMATIPVGESRIDLLEPTSEDSPVGRFLAERGEGLHHVALHVDDISGTLEALKARGVRLVSEDLQVGVDGRVYFFVQPESTAGVLVEICQDEITGV